MRPDIQIGRLMIATLMSVLLMSLLSIAHANSDGQQQSATTGGAVVAAVVNGESITVRAVERRVQKVLGDRTVSPGALKTLQAQALEQLIGRRIILSYLAHKQLGPSDQDILLATELAKDRLSQQGTTLDQFLQRSGQNEEEFRRTLQWQIGWQRYLDRYMTDKNLQNYFDRHRRQFDGTQIRVSQILLRVQRPDVEQAWDETIEQARRLRSSITSGATDFADAARSESAAPSGMNGGDIGFISRQEPMSESFSRAAYQLDVGQISEPVVSPFGVHLIRCDEVKPGQKRWHDVRPQLQTAVMQYLFDWVVRQQRPQATIRYTGSCPHFKSGTRQLAD